MLSYETERRLKDLLAAVGEGESRLEYKRQSLAQHYAFQPYDAFQRLDRDRNDYITPFELLNFLRDNRIWNVNEAECYKLLKYFDSDEDSRLSFADFKQMLLPCEDNFLRKYVQDRPTKYVGRYDYLDYNLER